MSPIPEHPSVTTLDGANGIIESDPTQSVAGEFQVMVHFGNGQRYWVPAQDLLLQEDGSYRLEEPLSAVAQRSAGPTLQSRPARFDAGNSGPVTAVAPQTAEESVAVAEATQVGPEAASAEGESRLVGGAQVFTGTAQPEVPAPDGDTGRVQLSRVVQTFSEVIDTPLMREEVSIHRVPVNEYVDAPPPIRYEDDRVIIPVVEEVLTVERRLLVKEEVVVTKRRTTVDARQAAERRSEDVVAEPLLTDTSPPLAEDSADVFQGHYAAHYAGQGLAFEYLEPAYRYGQTLATSDTYRGWPWNEVAPEARRTWESYNPGTWDRVAPAIEHGFSTSGRR